MTLEMDSQIEWAFKEIGVTDDSFKKIIHASMDLGYDMKEMGDYDTELTDIIKEHINILHKKQKDFDKIKKEYGNVVAKIEKEKKHTTFINKQRIEREELDKEARVFSMRWALWSTSVLYVMLMPSLYSDIYGINYISGVLFATLLFYLTSRINLLFYWRKVRKGMKRDMEWETYGVLRFFYKHDEAYDISELPIGEVRE